MAVLYRIREPEDAIDYAFDCIDNGNLLSVSNELSSIWQERFSHLYQILDEVIPRINTRTQSIINLKLAIYYKTSPMNIFVPISDKVQIDLVKSILSFTNKSILTEEEMVTKLVVRQYHH